MEPESASVAPQSSAADEIKIDSLAPQYAQLCGLLAGFAFVGFSIYVAQDNLAVEAANIAASLFAAFITLMLLAVLYALMASDASVNRVSTGIYVYGLPFGLSSVTLFYTLTLMALEHPELHATVQIGRIFVLIIGPAIVLARMNGGAIMLKAGRISQILPRRLGLVLVTLLVVIGLVLTIRPSIVASLRGHGVVPAYISLGAAIVSGALSPLIANRASESTLHRISIDIYLLVGFVALVASTAFAAAVLH